jgi:DNA replication protein DnaC
MKLINQIKHNCNQLKLKSIAENIQPIADQAAINGISYLEFMDQLLHAELEARNRRELERKIKDAKLPARHDLAVYDCALIKGMPPVKLAQLRELTWIDQLYNLIIIGPSGVGKTMLSAGLCHAAILGGYKAYFRTMDQIMSMLKAKDTLKSAQVEYRRLSKADLIVIDDIMMMDPEKRQANAFFHFINALHERASFIITTNKAPKEWGEQIGDEIITTAILDRLLYRCEVLKLSGESLRWKNRKDKISLG